VIFYVMMAKDRRPVQTQDEVVMSIVKRFVTNLRKDIASKSTKVQRPENLLIKFFHESEGKTDFPLGLALNGLENLEKEAKRQNESDLGNTQSDLFKRFLVEDILFASVYATFYEEVLVTVRENKELAIPLINQFEQDTENREKVILDISEAHLRFIERGGKCPGCAHCSNHKDVMELVGPWNKNQTDFFIKLYLGMQTILYSMEELIFEKISTNPERYVSALTHANILGLRQYIYSYVEENLS
jgi:hypothetical protein